MASIVKKKDGSVSESLTESRESSSSSSVTSSSEGEKIKGCASPSPLGWPIKKAGECKSLLGSGDSGGQEKNHHLEDSTVKKLKIDMMKERFAKLLLGEDMSGSGKGVCTALAISNAITNLCGTIFGQLWRLEPLPAEKKSMWRREMECLLCVGDHIVELIPSWQTFPDGSKLEVMTCRPRSDLFINLPALRKLDNMLLEILDSFTDTEFWYVDQGIVAPEADGSASFRKTIQRQEEKWWLPVPRVTAGGLTDNSRKKLTHTRECTNQILKAAMAINSIALADMDVPDSYLETLPKNGRACLGELVYRYITSDQFSADCLLDCLDLSSEHVALEIANRVESSIYVWRRRSHSKPPINPNRSTTKSSWGMVKDFMIDGDKRELLAERAESLLLSLKQRFPSLTQTSLDTSKIQYNKHSDKLSSVPHVSVIAHKKVSIPYSVPVSGTPYKTTTFSTPSFSPVPLISPARGERTPFLSNAAAAAAAANMNKHQRRGFGVRRVLTNYLGVDSKPKICGNSTEAQCPSQNSNSIESGSEHQKKEKLTHQNGSKLHQTAPRYIVS
ncbi:hypothetical protein Tsubulata_013430 [Turnera subulata]|uniref:PRONE domain-containing protein n=1 Tax=Turnera subulata TaxID=218843 RepID=A0A9Q0JBK0_9ROSI|nr:hypothetical protein Tsubulata_013430 [Turnera subulata]